MHIETYRADDLTLVRRRDLQRLDPARRPVPPDPDQKNDKNYPSPVDLRMAVAATIDMILHCAIAISSAVHLGHATTVDAVIAVVPAYLAISVLHRIVVQRFTAATAGKGLVGLQLIRVNTRGPPTVWLLIKLWFCVLSGVMDASG